MKSEILNIEHKSPKRTNRSIQIVEFFMIKWFKELNFLKQKINRIYKSKANVFKLMRNWSNISIEIVLTIQSNTSISLEFENKFKIWSVQVYYNVRSKNFLIQML